MNLKSERLKKLEIELKDLEQWLNLGLVPKKDIQKHEIEIESVKEKVSDEKERLRFLKENGDLEEYVTPKKSQRQVYADPHTTPDMDPGGGGLTETGFDMETTNFETETTMKEDKTDAEHTATDEEDDPFSDRNRWKRGVLEDPDGDNW